MQFPRATHRNVYVCSQRAGERVMAGIRTFLEKKLRLTVNEEKSAVDRPWRRKFLGFSLQKTKGRYKIRLASQSKDRLKKKLRDLTNRNRSENLEERVRKINTYLRGWIGYFGLIETLSVGAAERPRNADRPRVLPG